VGAGTTGSNWKVTIWGEGGTTITGPLFFNWQNGKGGFGQTISLWGDTYGFGTSQDTVFASVRDIQLFLRTYSHAEN
jgi:hypothetical protein